MFSPRENFLVFQRQENETLLSFSVLHCFCFLFSDKIVGDEGQDRSARLNDEEAKWVKNVTDQKSKKDGQKKTSILLSHHQYEEEDEKKKTNLVLKNGVWIVFVCDGWKMWQIRNRRFSKEGGKAKNTFSCVVLLWDCWKQRRWRESKSETVEIGFGFVFFQLPDDIETRGEVCSQRSGVQERGLRKRKKQKKKVSNYSSVSIFNIHFVLSFFPYLSVGTINFVLVERYFLLNFVTFTASFLFFSHLTTRCGSGMHCQPSVRVSWNMRGRRKEDRKEKEEKKLEETKDKKTDNRWTKWEMEQKKFNAQQFWWTESQSQREIIKRCENDVCWLLFLCACVFLLLVFYFIFLFPFLFFFLLHASVNDHEVVAEEVVAGASNANRRRVDHEAVAWKGDKPKKKRIK